MDIKGASYIPEWNIEDIDISARLIAAYKNTKNQDRGVFSSLTPNDLWTIIDGHSKIEELKKYLEKGNAEKLSKYFIEYWSTPSWFGGIDTFDSLDDNTGTYVYAELVKFIKSIGLDVYENDNIDDIINRVSNFLDIDIIPSPVIPVSGMNTSKGIMHYRHITSLYMSIMIKKFTNSTNNICEYGGGLGLNAYFLHKMNRKNVHIFDLPFVNVISGYFLIKALGHDAVVLEGEEDKKDAIHIKAFWNCNKYPKNFFEVSANQDSFPEIDINLVNAYFEEIRFNTKSYFYA